MNHSCFIHVLSLTAILNFFRFRAKAVITYITLFGEIRVFKKTIDPYENVVDFIGAAIEASEINQMLLELDKLPDNIRRNTLTKTVSNMRREKESIEFIQIMEMMMDKNVLQAMNNVITDIEKTKLHTINSETLSSNNNFAILIGLIAAL